MSDTKQATPHENLMASLRDPRIPKTEREHAAVHEMATLAKEVLELDAEIAALRAQVEWRPIETAPKEDCEILLFHKDWGVEIGEVYRGRVDCIGFTNDTPTHWMPLPPPPGE